MVPRTAAAAANLPLENDNPGNGTTLASLEYGIMKNPAALRGRLAMVMDRINGFSSLSRELLNRFSGAEAAPSRDDDVPAGQAPKGDNRSPQADKADISPKAHRLIALRNAMESGLRALDDVPEVRPDRVAEARARLGRGFYNSVEVRTRVAERLDDVAQKMEDI